MIASSSEPNTNMENNVNPTSEQTQTRSDSPINEFDTQQTNGERPSPNRNVRIKSYNGEVNSTK